MNRFFNNSRSPLSILAFALLFSFKGFSQQVEKTYTYKNFDLKSSVKSITSHVEEEFGGESNSYKKEDLEFNKAGKLLVWTTYKSDSEINIQNNVLEHVELDNKTSNGFEYKSTFEYDDKGNIISGISYNPDGSVDTFKRG